MSEILDSALAESSIGVCVKDMSSRVLMQNEFCLETCGERSGEVCIAGCMKRYTEDDLAQWNRWGIRLYRNIGRKGNSFDAAVVATEHHLITLLQPLQDKHTKALEYYRAMGLTPRELEIISKVIQGFSNPDICEKLSISRATLKTHLYHVYQKVENLGKVPDYLPTRRRVSKTTHANETV